MKICVIGHAGCGKDTVCELLRDMWGLRFVSATDMMIERIIYPCLGPIYSNQESDKPASQHLVINDLRKNKDDWRTLWFELTRFYNRHDPARHIRNVMEVSDICCGVRDRKELDAAKEDGMFDLVVWVDASDRVEDEPTSSITVSAGDADFVLNNNGTEVALVDEVINMMEIVRLPLSFD